MTRIFTQGRITGPTNRRNARETAVTVCARLARTTPFAHAPTLPGVSTRTARRDDLSRLAGRGGRRPGSRAAAGRAAPRSVPSALRHRAAHRRGDGPDA